MECFNRSYAGQHGKLIHCSSYLLLCFFTISAAAFGQGCYFATDATYSDGFAVPDQQGIRRMFLGKNTLRFFSHSIVVHSFIV